MPCLLAILAWFFPRIFILILAFTTDYLQRALGSWAWIVLGFLFLPLTTLAVAFSINHAGGVQGLYIVLVILAVISDLGLSGDSARRARRRRVDVVAVRRKN
jgi:hypothetical protein